MVRPLARVRRPFRFGGGSGLGRLWVGSGSGLGLFAPDCRRLTYAGWVGFGSLVGRLWVGSGSGVIRFVSWRMGRAIRPP